MKFRQPSRGTKAAIFLPFLISWARTHLRMAELGCLASMRIFSSTMPLQCDEPPKGLHLNCVPRFAFLYALFAHLFLTRVVRSLRAALMPRGFPEPMALPARHAGQGSSSTRQQSAAWAHGNVTEP